MPDDTMLLAQIQKEILAKAGIEYRTIIKTNSFELIRDMVASGMAISIQTHFFLARDPNRPNIRSIPLKGPYRIPHALVCCVRAGRELPVATATFVEAVRMALAEQHRVETV
jgi:DNA-binding transcriptional LysR family regulator